MKTCQKCNYQSRDINQEYCPYDNTKLVNVDVSIKQKLVESNETVERLTFPFGKVSGIFFPVGRLENGGTCEFSTSDCLLRCKAVHDVPKKSIKIPYEKKRKIFEYMINSNRITIYNKIWTEILDFREKIGMERVGGYAQMLYWFASGDCPSKFTEPIYDIMELFDKHIIVQCGFTRNKELWEKVDKLRKCKIVLTVEDIEEVESICTEGRVCGVPDFHTGRVSLYTIKQGKLQYSGDCSRNYSYHDKIKKRIPVKKRKPNCHICHKNSEGCFTVLKE